MLNDRTRPSNSSRERAGNRAGQRAGGRSRHSSCTPYRSAEQSRLCGLISNCFPSEYFFSRYLIPKKGFFDARFASGRLCSASQNWRELLLQKVPPYLKAKNYLSVSNTMGDAIAG